MTHALKTRFQSPRLGLGCMNLSHAYGTPLAETQAIAVLRKAFDLGYRHFDTATLYGNGVNEHLLGKALSHLRDEFFLASKCGMAINETGKKVIDGRPSTLRKQCEDSLRRLNTDVIDLYYLHRKDPSIDITESVGALNDLVNEGKIRAIGLSEVSAATLQKAHQEAPIGAVQSEYSLWTRNPEIAIKDLCQHLGVSFVAFSPLARGFLTASVSSTDSLVAQDIRLNMPRFQGEHFEKNRQLLAEFQHLATAWEVSLAQLALAWVLHQGDHIIAIPGTRSIAHMQDNFTALDVTLTPEQLSCLNQLINQQTVSGPRYNAAQQQEIDTEEFDGS